jgi:hypothetical protein
MVDRALRRAMIVYRNTKLPAERPAPHLRDRR